ncbi:hypothetical protein [Chitinophaga arvensicola]|uniref:hypothetical protein n=1 Tax=Chitinophaga arvensicola TaxID=29529 RepID=UPI00115FCE5B|nr:hypothetical protein [Chitinophaga arvensicola]
MIQATSCNHQPHFPRSLQAFTAVNFVPANVNSFATKLSCSSFQECQQPKNFLSCTGMCKENASFPCVLILY